MPAYSFKGQFVPYVEEGSKPHTIRARRKNPAKKGDTLYLYFGLRTKFCRKLREEKCTDVKTIVITKKSIYIFDTRLSDQDCEYIKQCHINGFKKIVVTNVKELNEEERNQLAWRDGFRPDGSTKQNPKASFELMIRFWNQTHDLPFIGYIIYWEPYQTKAKNYDFCSRNHLETALD